MGAAAAVKILSQKIAKEGFRLRDSGSALSLECKECVQPVDVKPLWRMGTSLSRLSTKCAHPFGHIFLVAAAASVAGLCKWIVAARRRMILKPAAAYLNKWSGTRL